MYYTIKSFNTMTTVLTSLECVECNLTFRDNWCKRRHFNGLKHNPQNKKSYTCCGWTTNNKAHMTKHKLSKRHIRLTNAINSAVTPLP